MTYQPLLLVENAVEGLWNLPDGWEWRTLGGNNGVCLIKPRRLKQQQKPDQIVSFVPMEAVDDVSGTITELQTREYIQVKTGFTYFEEGDVIFAKITPSMQNGKSAIARGLIGGMGFGSTEFHVLRPQPGVIPEWIHLFVRRLSFRQEAMQHFQGAVGHKRVPQEFLEQHPIPIPYPDEPIISLRIQRAIVARIEALLVELREIHELHAAINRDVGMVMSSVLEETYNQLSEKYSLTHTARVCTSITDGNHNTPKYSSEDVPFLFVANIVNRKLDFGNTKFVPMEYYETITSSRKPEIGDILYSVVGSFGVPVIVDTDQPFAFQRHIAILKPDRNKIESNYLRWMLDTPQVFRQAEKVVTGAAQKTLTLTHLRKLEFPFPEQKDVQRKIASYLDDVYSEVLEMSEIQAADDKLLDQVEQSILEQAFRGEL